MHALIAAGDAEAIFQMAEPIWDRAAFIYTSDQPSGRAYVDNSSLGLEGRYAPVRSDGAILQPLMFLGGDHRDAALQFGANNRIVRFRPDPINWEVTPAGSEIFDWFPVAFYKTQDGTWHLAAIITGL